MQSREKRKKPREKQSRDQQRREQSREAEDGEEYRRLQQIRATRSTVEQRRVDNIVEKPPLNLVQVQFHMWTSTHFPHSQCVRCVSGSMTDNFVSQVICDLRISPMKQGDEKLVIYNLDTYIYTTLNLTLYIYYIQIQIHINIHYNM